MWDYVGDGYVHRLIQGQDANNKVVEYQTGSGNQDEKLESITLEVTEERFPKSTTTYREILTRIKFLAFWFLVYLPLDNSARVPKALFRRAH